MAVDRVHGAPLTRLRRRAPVSLRAAASRALAHEHAPLAVVALGALAIAALASLVAVRVNAIALDETLLKQSAVHYGSNFPHSLLHDLTARGTSRLYSLVLAPVFVAFDGDVAVRAARGLNTVLYSSAAIPVYLLARQVLARRWLAAVPALLSVAAPWLILTTALYTENVTFPLFLWTVWAIERAVRAPAPGRDLLALVLIVATTCARTQFGILFVAYWLCVGLAPLLAARARGSIGDALPVVARRWRQGHPFALVSVAGVVLYVLYLAGHGRLHYEVQAIFGSYSEIQDRTSISSDMSVGLMIEVVALSLGIGLAPAIVAIAWFAGILKRPQRPEWTFAFVAVVVVLVFGVATVYAQGGYLGTRTEERYYFYAVPLLWIAAVAALRRGGPPSPRALCFAGGALALLFATVVNQVPLTPESDFLAPVLAGLGRLLPVALDHLGIAGLTVRDLLFAVGLAATGILALTWRPLPRGRWLLVLAVPVALQMTLTVYAFGVARGDARGIPPRTGPVAGLAWVDHALPYGVNAVWLAGQGDEDPGAPDEQRATLFWNDQLGAVESVPALRLPPVTSPLDALPSAEGRVDPASGVLEPPPPGPVVQAAASPHLQLAGRRIASSGRFELVDAGSRARVRWLARSLAGDGSIVPGATARFVATAPQPGRRTTLTLTLAPVTWTRTTALVRLGDVRRRVALPVSPVPRLVRVHVSACLPVARAASATLAGRGFQVEPDGRQLTFRLVAVDLAPAPGRCPSR